MICLASFFNHPLRMLRNYFDALALDSFSLNLTRGVAGAVKQGFGAGVCAGRESFSSGANFSKASMYRPLLRIQCNFSSENSESSSCSRMSARFALTEGFSNFQLQLIEE